MERVNLNRRPIYLPNSRLCYVAHILPQAIVNTIQDVITYTKTINHPKTNHVLNQLENQNLTLQDLIR